MLRTIAIRLMIAVLAVTTFSCGERQKSQPPRAAAVSESQPAKPHGPASDLPASIRIGIGTIIDHPALQAAIDGFKEALSAAGYREGDNLRVDVRNAQGVEANIATIASGLVGERLTLILSVGTAMTRAIAEREPKVPLLFTAVTDPVSSGIVASLEHPGRPISGTSDMNPVAAQLKLIREMQPSAKTVGILYNPGEANSVVLVKIAKAAAPSLGLAIVEGTAYNTAGVRAAASSLVGKVDAVYMPTDNTMAAAINVIIDVCRDNRLPFYSSESPSVESGGAIAALAVEYRGLGRQTGNMALAILRGGRPEDMPIQQAKSFDLYVNSAVARQLGINIPEAVRTRATKIIS